MKCKTYKYIKDVLHIKRKRGEETLGNTYRCEHLEFDQFCDSDPGPEHPWWDSSRCHKKQQCLLLSGSHPHPHFELKG